jgi:serine/threonine-protein kinase
LDRLVGRVFVDRYEVEAKLGDGAMGVVYRARHLKIGRRFAIKILRPRLMADAKLVERFEREAELAGKLSHPNVVSVVDMSRTDDGLYYYAMELAPGQALADLMTGQPLDAERAIALTRQICAGLEHAHEVGLVHRDLKPDNVLVDAGDRVRIVDFGLAVPRDDSDGRFTTAGMVVGTPRYMSPEQARGERVDHRTDLYALGLILYEMLAGKPPFEGDGVDVAVAHVSTVTPPFGIRVPTVRVDPVLEALALRLLEKDPDRRIQSAAEVTRLLDLVETDRVAAARALRVALPADTSETLPALDAARPPRSRIWLVAAAAALFLAAAAFVFVLADGKAPAPTAPTLADVTKESPVIKFDDPALAPHDDPAPPPVHLLAPIAPFTAPALAHDPTAQELALLYAAVGRELSALEARSANAAIDLWPRYRWIRINDALVNADKRRQAFELLERLRRDVAAANR